MINDFLNSPWLMFGFWLVVLFFVVLWLTLVYWTIADAGRRGAIRPYWGGMAIVFPFVGSLVYLILRPPEYLLDSRERELEVAVLERELKQRIHSCPDCRSPVEKDYILCPECGLDLKKPCENCRKPLRLKWVICPYCGTSQREKNLDF